MAAITQIRFGLWGRPGGLLAEDPLPPVTPGPGPTTYLRNAVLDHVFGGSAFTQPAAVYASLHSDYPDETGENEVAGGSYARQAVTFAAAAAGTKANNAVISWPGMPQTAVTHVGLWDAAGGGNLLYAEGLPVARAVEAGNTVQVATANLQTTLQ